LDDYNTTNPLFPVFFTLNFEKMYGAGVFYEDAANILMQQTYAGAVDESGVDIVSRPTVEVTQIEKGQHAFSNSSAATSIVSFAILCSKFSTCTLMSIVILLKNIYEWYVHQM